MHNTLTVLSQYLGRNQKLIPIQKVMNLFDILAFIMGQLSNSLLFIFGVICSDIGLNDGPHIY